VTFRDADIPLLGEEDLYEGSGRGIFSPGDINDDVLTGPHHGEHSNLLLGGPR
jgi:hypothetical protein